MKENNLTKVWIEYQRGKDYLQLLKRYDQADKNNNFYIGRQWEGLEAGEMPMPTKNFIKPICNYKIGVVAQNTLAVVYSSANTSDEDLKENAGESFRDVAEKTFKYINRYADKLWEKFNMDALQWDLIKEACVTGDVYIYNYNDEEENEKIEIVDDNNIYFSDENSEDIQSQEYILITFRRPVNQIREEAKSNGIPEDKIDMIIADEETDEQIGNKEEVKTDNGKCLCILKMFKKENEEGKVTVHTIKSTKQIEYEKETDTKLSLYPVAKYGWVPLKNSIRSMGEPEPLINNQIETNKTLARRVLATTIASYPKLAYLEDKIGNPASLTTVGVGIAISGNDVEDINKAVTYLRPSQISPDAKNLNDELVKDTRELEGAGDVSLGITNPEQASGKSIIAVRDNAALPLNSHVARYRKFIEDLARIWLDMWQNQVDLDGKRIVIEEPDEEIKKIEYGEIEQPEPDLIPTYEKEKAEDYPDKPIVKVIPYDVLQKLKANIRIDVTNSNPYSKYAEEQSIEALYTKGDITLEEYVELLPNDSVTPKDKLEKMLEERKTKQKQINEIEKEMIIKKQNMEQQQMDQSNIIPQDIIPEDTIDMQSMEGVDMNEMQPM